MRCRREAGAGGVSEKDKEGEKVLEEEGEEEKEGQEGEEEEGLSCGTAGWLARERRSVLSNRRPEIITPGWWRIESSSLRNRRSRGAGKTHVYLSAEAPPPPSSNQPQQAVVGISPPPLKRTISS